MRIKHFISLKQTLKLEIEIGEIWVVVVLFFKFHVLFPVRV